MNNPEKPKQRHSVGILIGPGASGVKTFGNEFFGLDTAIEDHGTNNTHLSNKIYEHSIPFDKNIEQTVAMRYSQSGATASSDDASELTDLHNGENDAQSWDLFLSHASEDKEFVRPLAQALQAAGLKVWYDEFSLKLGDSLRRSIDKGLASSKFGIVVLSPDFFKKEWPARELDGLVAREIKGKKVILPIWHNLTHDDVVKHSPPLADKLGISSSKEIGELVAAILKVIE